MTSLFTNRLIVVKETGQWSGSPETNIESSMSLSFKDELLNFKGHKNKATTVITDKYLNQYEEVLVDGQYVRKAIGNKKKEGRLTESEIEYYVDRTPIRVIEKLFIGSADAAENLQALKSNGVTAVLNVATNIPNYYTTEFTYHKHDFPDLPTEPIIDYLDPLVDFVHNSISSGGTVLVHCNQGVSRSASVVIAYLMKHQRKSYNDAFSILFSARPKVQPNYGFVSQLQVYEKKVMISSASASPAADCSPSSA